MATEHSAMFCMFLVIVQTSEDMVLIRRVNQPEKSLLEMLRRKLVSNNVDYEESTTEPTTPSSPPVCIIPNSANVNSDVYNPYKPKHDNMPRDTNYPSRTHWEAQTNTNPEPHYNPYHHPHYKPLHNPGYAPFHRAPYVIYAPLDPLEYQPSDNPIFLRAENEPSNQVGQTSLKYLQNSTQVSELPESLVQLYPSEPFRSLLDLQQNPPQPSPPFLQAVLRSQPAGSQEGAPPERLPQEANQFRSFLNVNLPPQQNPQYYRNYSHIYYPPHPTQRNVFSKPYNPSPQLYVPKKPSHRSSYQLPVKPTNQLVNSSSGQIEQKQKSQFRAYRFIPTSRAPSTTTVMTFPTNSLKSLKRSDAKLHRLVPYKLLPERIHRRIKTILNSTKSQSDSLEAWHSKPSTDKFSKKITFKGFKLAKGVTPIVISSESGEVEKKGLTKEEKIDLEEMLNQVMKRADQLRSTQEPQNFQKYQNESYAFRRSNSYLQWKLSHVIA